MIIFIHALSLSPHLFLKRFLEIVMSSDYIWQTDLYQNVWMFSIANNVIIIRPVGHLCKFVGVITLFFNKNNYTNWTKRTQKCCQMISCLWQFSTINFETWISLQYCLKILIIIVFTQNRF